MKGWVQGLNEALDREFSPPCCLRGQDLGASNSRRVNSSESASKQATAIAIAFAKGCLSRYG